MLWILKGGLCSFRSNLQGGETRIFDFQAMRINEEYMSPTIQKEAGY